MRNNALENISLNISLSLLIGIFCLFALSSLGFIFGISINLFYSLAGIIAAIFVPIKLGKFKINESLIALILTTIIVLLSVFVAEEVMDFSHDGQWYHQTGVLFLKKGWNPVYTTALDYFQGNWNANVNGLVWVECYPKFYEIFAANIYYLTNNIETGKMLNSLSAAVLFFYGYYVFKNGLLKEKNKTCLLFSLLLVCNPVFFAQIFTYYADGLVYIYFMMMILALVDIEQANKSSLISRIILVMSGISLACLKLGGLIYCLFILIAYAGYKLIYHEKLNNLGKMASMILIGVIICSVNPYFTNLYRGKHILYPVAGAEKIDVMKHNMPPQFFDKPMPYKLFMSTFSPVDNLMAQYATVDDKVILKIPFTMRSSELQNLKIPDTRQCGFGIFWSGILLSSILLAFFIRFKNSQMKKTCFLVLGTILLSVLLNPENWWARYVPQFYAIPTFICLFCLISPFKKIKNCFSLFLCCIIFFNTMLTYQTVYNKAKIYTAHKTIQMTHMELLKRTQNMIKDLEQTQTREDFTAPVLIFLDKYKRK